MENFGFIDIKNQPPPINKPIILRLFDQWRGEGEEVEEIVGTYDGTTFKTMDGKDIWRKLITGWRSV